MEKLSGLVLQLKVKTGFIVADDLDEVVDDIIDNIVVDNQDKIEKIKETIPAQQRVGLYATKITEFKLISEIEQKLLSFTALREHAEMYFVPAGKSTLGDYDFYKKIDKEIENIRLEYKSKLNTNKIMSTTAFEKLNTISDTIPNIINQILSLALGISKIVVTKITEWPTEISNEDLSRVIDTSNELVEDVALINSKAGIQPYITIYKKLKKPIEDIYKSVNEMGKLAGVISYDDNVKNQFKYTNATGDQGAETKEEAILRAIESVETMFADIKVSILNRSPRKQIIENINTINKVLKDNNIYKDTMAPSFDLLSARAKSKAKGDQIWIEKTEVEIDDAVGVILNSVLTYLQSTGASGVGETKGAGKFMHSYHAKRFL
jgi:hypothetical protein